MRMGIGQIGQIGQIGTVSNELCGNNCDGFDLAHSPEGIPSMAITGLLGTPEALPVTRSQNVLRSEMLWTHHWTNQHDRCAHIGGRLVCRRCLVLYPVTFVVLVLAHFGIRWPENLDTLLLFALPLPLVLDFVSEHMGFTRYSPRRQVATTFLGAIALGHAFARYLDHHNDPRFWTMVSCYGGLCAGALVVHHLRDRRSLQQQDAIREAADPLVHGFANRDEMLAYLDQ